MHFSLSRSSLHLFYLQIYKNFESLTNYNFCDVLDLPLNLLLYISLTFDMFFFKNISQKLGCFLILQFLVIYTSHVRKHKSFKLSTNISQVSTHLLKWMRISSQFYFNGLFFFFFFLMKIILCHQEAYITENCNRLS